MPCPYCGAVLADGARLCTTCGRLIAPRQPGQPPSPAPPTNPLPGQTAPLPGPAGPLPGPAGPSPSGEPRPVYRPGTSYTTDPYGPVFDLGSLPPETLAAWRQHRFQATFSVLVLVLIHFLSLGLASPFLIARKYTFLPRVKPDDFSTPKAAGFLFIPFYGMYWVFVLCRRIVDRLGLQARLWNLPDAGVPSRGLATALAIVWVLGAIPYVGLLFWFPLQFALWPIFLVQVQRFCNRLALEAAPPDVRPSMLALEGATRLRWLGWIIVVPCVLMIVASLVVAVVAPPGPISEMIVGLIFVLAVAGGGGVLLYLGERGARAPQDHLADQAPTILAGYVRIDKNAAWSVAWIAIPLAATFVLAGLTTVYGPAPTTAREDGWPSVAVGATLGVGAAYAVLRALQARQEITRLLEMPPHAESETPRW